MEILLDDMARTLEANVQLPKHSAEQPCLLQEKLKHVSAEIRAAEESLVPADANEEQLVPPIQLPNPSLLGTQTSPFNLRNHFDLETGGEDSTYRPPASPTPSPSPPLATSPPYQLSSLNLIDSVAQQQFPDTDILRHINTAYRAQSKREMLDGGRPMRSGVACEGSRGGVQARC